MPPYSTVFIDWYKTLSFDKFWGHWSEPSHPRNSAFHALQQAFFADPDKLVVPWMRGDLSAEQAVRQVAPRVGVEKELLLRELAASCQAMDLVSPEVPS